MGVGKKDFICHRLPFFQSKMTAHKIRTKGKKRVIFVRHECIFVVCTKNIHNKNSQPWILIFVAHRLRRKSMFVASPSSQCLLSVPQPCQLSQSAPSIMEPLLDSNTLIQARAHIQTRKCCFLLRSLDCPKIIDL